MRFRLFNCRAESLISFLLLILATSSSVAASTEEKCERDWIVDSNTLTKPTGSYSGLLKQWTARENTCGSTSVYWGRLAIIHLLSNDLKLAKESLARAPKRASSYSYVTDIAGVQLVIHERLENPAPVTRAELERFESAYQSVVAKHPAWPTGYALLGGMQTTMGKHREAVRNLQVALGGESYQLWGVYRNLAISLSALGMHNEALMAGDKAVESNANAKPLLFADPAFMLAGAISHAALGYLDDAGDLLKVIAARRPEVRNDPDYLRAVQFHESQRSKRK